MALLRFPLLLLSLTVLGCSIASAAQPEVQHLTCIKDPQGMMCTVDETQEAILLKSSPQSTQRSFLSSDQLSTLSDILIGLIFLGLPIALVLSVLIHDKRDMKRIQQVEQLERIWQQS